MHIEVRSIEDAIGRRLAERDREGLRGLDDDLADEWHRDRLLLLSIGELPHSRSEAFSLGGWDKSLTLGYVDREPDVVSVTDRVLHHPMSRAEHISRPTSERDHLVNAIGGAAARRF